MLRDVATSPLGLNLDDVERLLTGAGSLSSKRATIVFLALKMGKLVEGIAGR